MFQNTPETNDVVINQNTTVLCRYPIGTNIVISDPESHLKKRYGTVVGYKLNCFGELCVKVDLATFDGTQDLHVLHTYNKMFTIKVVS